MANVKMRQTAIPNRPPVTQFDSPLHAIAIASSPFLAPLQANFSVAMRPACAVRYPNSDTG